MSGSRILFPATWGYPQCTFYEQGLTYRRYYITSDEEKYNLYRVNLFCVFSYVLWYLQSSVAEKALNSDLLALKHTKQYAYLGTELAGAVYTSNTTYQALLALF